MKKSLLASMLAALAVCLTVAVFAQDAATYTPSAAQLGKRLANQKDRNKKLLDQITEFVLRTALNERLKWEFENFEFRVDKGNHVTQCTVLGEGGVSNNSNNGFGGPGNQNQASDRNKAFAEGKVRPYKPNPEVFAALLTEQFGKGKSTAERLAEASTLFSTVDIRNKDELQEAAAAMPEIKEQFTNCYETDYALEPLERQEIEKMLKLIQDYQVEEFTKLQFRNMNEQWTDWPVKYSDIKPKAEWRLHLRFKPFNAENLFKVEKLLAEIEFPLYHENELISISFSPTDRVARRTFSGGFKRIGRFKLSIGKDILGMDDLPEHLRARFDPILNNIARNNFLGKHPLLTDHKNALGDAIKAKVDEMQLNQFEQNLPKGWVYVDGAWRLPEDLVEGILAYRSGEWYLQPKSMPNGADLRRYAEAHDDITITPAEGNGMR